MPGKTEKQEEKESRIPLTSLASRFIAEWMEKKLFYRCRVKISKKKFRSKIKAMKEWIKARRTLPLEQMFKTANAKLRGAPSVLRSD